MASITFPTPLYHNGLRHIPPPPFQEFETEFAGVLPPGQPIQSSWGTIQCYDFNPTASTTARRVLLIHGGGSPAIGMAPLARQLTEIGNHVVAYDLWGHGCSSTPLEPHTQSLTHAQILSVLAHLRWPSAHIVCFSLSGVIAPSFACVPAHAHLVESIAIIAGLGVMTPTPEFENLSDEQIWDVMQGGAIKEGWQTRLRDHGIVEPGPIQAWERQNHKGYLSSLVSYWRHLDVFGVLDAYRMLPRLTPVLAILASEDAIIKAVESRTALLGLGWKESDVVVVEGADHEIVRSHAGIVAGLLEGFWAGVKVGGKE